MKVGMRHRLVLDVSGDPILTDVRQPGSEGRSSDPRTFGSMMPPRALRPLAIWDMLGKDVLALMKDRYVEHVL